METSKFRQKILLNDRVIGLQILSTTITLSYTSHSPCPYKFFSNLKASRASMEISLLPFRTVDFSCSRTLIKTMHSSQNVTFVYRKLRCLSRRHLLIDELLVQSWEV